jgi:multiple sugar transport system permease protein
VKKPESFAKRVALYLALLLGSTVVLVPLLWVFMGSIKSASDVIAAPIKWLPYISFEPRFDNFLRVFSHVNLGRAFLNTLIMAGTILLANLIFCPLAGFALAKYKFPGRNLVFIFILANLMIPVETTVIPLYSMVAGFGWLDTYCGLIVPVAIEAFAVFLARQHIAEVPNDLLAAARVDGCGDLRIFVKVILPLCTPLIVSLSIFTFTLSWNSFYWPLMVTTSRRLSVVTLALGKIVTLNDISYNLLMAGAVLAILPVVTLYLILQERFIEGMTMTGLKM